MDRSTINAQAAHLLNQFIQKDLQMSIRAFAKLVGVAESSLRYFLANNSGSAGRQRHSRGPYASTLRPILELCIPDALRESLLDVIYYEERVAARKLGLHGAQR
jgi:hypothetical protein